MTITPQQLGDRLRRAREACALSRDHASAHLDISLATLASIEHGRRTPTGTELDALAYIYGLRSHDLLSDDDVIVENPDLRGTARPEALEAERKRIAVAHAIADLERTMPIVDPLPLSPTDRLLHLASTALHLDLISPAKLAELRRLAHREATPDALLARLIAIASFNEN